MALDHYVWGINMAARQAYWEECASRRVLPDHSRDLTDFWDESLPGRKGFDLARAVLDSSVESVVDDYMTMDRDRLGTFDVVLYLGVLYHMTEPMTALRRVRALTAEVGVVETVAIQVLAQPDASLLAFYPGERALGRGLGRLVRADRSGACRNVQGRGLEPGGSRTRATRCTFLARTRRVSAAVAGSSPAAPHFSAHSNPERRRVAERTTAQVAEREVDRVANGSAG